MAISAQNTAKTMNPTTSKAIKDLKSRRDSLQSQSNALERKQDFWHEIALATGVIAAALALVAGGAQRVESKRSYSLRGVSKDLNEVDGRLYTLQIEREKTARVELLRTLAYRGFNNLQLGEIRKKLLSFRALPFDITYSPAILRLPTSPGCSRFSSKGGSPRFTRQISTTRVEFLFTTTRAIRQLPMPQNNSSKL